MRSRLFGNQNRELIENLISLRHFIGRRVGTDGKFPHRKTVMVLHDNLFYQCPAFLLILKVGTAVISHSSVFKFHIQIFELEITDINTADKESSLRTGKYRGREYLPHRDIDICHTVFEICLLSRVLQSAKRYL